uniref:Uncharacterized protein n=1 Tax=Cacopsylla melanoneura TaxID=428564 RepID=A0A8D9A4Y1_9HEMI
MAKRSLRAPTSSKCSLNQSHSLHLNILHLHSYQYRPSILYLSFHGASYIYVSPISMLVDLVCTFQEPSPVPTNRSVPIPSPVPTNSSVPSPVPCRLLVFKFHRFLAEMDSKPFWYSNSTDT